MPHCSKQLKATPVQSFAEKHRWPTLSSMCQCASVILQRLTGLGVCSWRSSLSCYYTLEALTESQHNRYPFNSFMRILLFFLYPPGRLWISDCSICISGTFLYKTNKATCLNSCHRSSGPCDEFLCVSGRVPQPVRSLQLTVGLTREQEPSDTSSSAWPVLPFSIATPSGHWLDPCDANYKFHVGGQAQNAWAVTLSF